MLKKRNNIYDNKSIEYLKNVYFLKMDSLKLPMIYYDEEWLLKIYILNNLLWNYIKINY